MYSPWISSEIRIGIVGVWNARTCLPCIAVAVYGNPHFYCRWSPVAEATEAPGRDEASGGPVDEASLWPHGNMESSRISSALFSYSSGRCDDICSRDLDRRCRVPNRS